MGCRVVAEHTVVRLDEAQFRERERVLAACGSLVASTFRYETGVAGLRISNGVGEIEVLPFQGQQIWRARFLGRELAMGSTFPEPVPTTDYLSTYGAFFLHCGVTAMGNPSAQDTHPTHGELPNAPYRQAELVIGVDEGVRFMAVSGEFRYAVAFGAHYVARPVITLRDGSTQLTVEITIENRASSPLELMYLAHINYRPIDNATIVDTDARSDPENLREMLPGRRFDPEIVLTVEPKADERGWAHSMQVHPDGTADFVRHRPDHFGHALRWISRNGDREALGLLLPATAEAEGYLAERAKGNLRMLEPGATAHFLVECGALDEAAAVEMAREIARTMDPSHV